MARIRAWPDSSLEARITGARALRGVRAGSALVRIGSRLLAIQDDAWAGAWIDPARGTVCPVTFSGDAAPLPKKRKPDFEAAFCHGGSVFVLSSGSRPNRHHVVQFDPSSGRARVKEAPAFFDGLAALLGTRPNIEGALPRGGVVRLLHRGAGASSSALIDVSVAALGAGALEVRLLRRAVLGSIGGVPLHFTDAAMLDARRALYLAVAERTDDAVNDGPVAGMALGVMTGASARWAPLLERDGTPSRRKAEGVVVAGRNAWLLTDPDDPDRPAELCRVRLAGF